MRYIFIEIDLRVQKGITISMFYLYSVFKKSYNHHLFLKTTWKIPKKANSFSELIWYVKTDIRFYILENVYVLKIKNNQFENNCIGFKKFKIKRFLQMAYLQ